MANHCLKVLPGTGSKYHFFYKKMIPTCESSFSETIHAIPKMWCGLESRTREVFVIGIRIIVATDCIIEILCETVHATNTESPASDGKLGDDGSRSIFMRFFFFVKI